MVICQQASFPSLHTHDCCIFDPLERLEDVELLASTGTCAHFMQAPSPSAQRPRAQRLKQAAIQAKVASKHKKARYFNLQSPLNQ